MNEAMHERLSALSDGELHRDDARFVLRGLDGATPMRALWGRYHLTRDCLRRSEIVMPCAGFADTVLARIASEAAPHRARTWFKSAAGGLIAASVAAIALLAIAPATLDVPTDTVVSTPALAGNTGLRTEDLRPQLPARTASTGSILGAPLLPVSPAFGEQELDGYFIDHGDAAYGTGRYAFAPYVYVVSGPSPTRAADANARMVADRRVENR